MTLGNGVTFAECLPRSTRQRIHLCRVPPGTLGKGPAREGPHVRLFAECYLRHSAKRASLPSATDITLGKEPIPVPRSWFFAECYGLDTRQRTSLPSVTLGKVTRKSIFLFVFAIPSKQTKDIYHSHHIIYHLHTELTHLSSTPYISQISPHKSGFTAHKSH
jgi:hypothetical protein